MASSTKLICFFFLLTTIQIHARDSQFFSKVSRNRNYATDYPNNNYYNNQDNNVTALPFSKQQREEEEQPSYNIPKNTQGSFGLYDHDTGLDLRTTSTDTKPTTLYNMDDNSVKNPKIYNNNNNNYENNENNQKENGDEPKLEGLSETSYTNNNDNVVPWKYAAQNNYISNKNNNNNYINYNNNNRGNEGKYNGGVEKQGMSDTRYLENGKYFYDISLEKNLNNDFSYNNNNNNFDNNYNKGKLSGVNNNYYNGNGMQQGYNSQFSENEFNFDDQP